MKTVVITGFAFQGTDELRRHEYLMKPGPPVRTPVGAAPDDRRDGNYHAAPHRALALIWRLGFARSRLSAFG